MSSIPSDEETHLGVAKAARGAAILYAQGLVNIVAGLVFILLITRLLSKTEVGELYTITTFGTIFATLGGLAVFNSVTKFVASGLGQKDRVFVNRIVSTTITLGLVMSLVMTLAVFVVFPVIFNTLQVHLPLDFPWGALALDVACSCFLGYLIAPIQGKRKYDLQSVSIILVTTLRFAGAILFLVGGGGINGIVFGWAIGNGLGIVVVIGLAIKQFQPIVSASVSELKRILWFSAPLFLLMIVGQINSNFDRIAILGILNVDALAIYNTGLSIALLLTIAGSALYNVSLAELSTAAGSGLEKVKEVTQTTFRYVFLVYIPISVAMSIFAIPIISILFTKAYFDSFIVIMLIGFTRSLFCYDFVTNGFLLAVDKPRVLLEAGVLASIIQIAPALLLIRPFQIVGATVSRCLMIIILAIYPMIVTRQRFGLTPDFRFQMKTLISAYIPVLPALVLIRFGSQTPFVSLPLAAFVYGLLYFFGLRVQSTIEQNDIETLSALFPKKLQRPIKRILDKLIVKSEKLENR